MMVNPLFKLMTIVDGLQIFRDSFDYKRYFANRNEESDLKYALRRVLAEDIVAMENIPGFNRSTVDGYALKASDTFGASGGLPAYLEVTGEIKMSEIPSLLIRSGQAVQISTGGMLPEGADAVVMLEYTEKIDKTMIEVNRPVAAWENVLKEDEDIKKDEIVFKKGHSLRPQDIGLLAALGWENIPVYKKSELPLFLPGMRLCPFISSQTWAGKRYKFLCLRGRSKETGCIPYYRGIIADNEIALEEELSQCLKQNEIDMILVSGGSSIQ